ncbi:response regulator transcription factor [Actinokineospora spheciospongiae]|uniref:response regulator transcription factor n=1 Tax=Actinokineospora spheciospongiae TaxID=909613 RepID=UPI000D70A709|nr:response regulator transcription factor [Actinokineospora spheciospongiae]PWW62758.1 DNA-binding response OmpR family regulator [Actinokineospora spheciospongiae]
MRILVVEDDDGVAAAVVDALVARGHGVVRAARAAEVPGLRPGAELVLLDLTLPDGDGLEVLRDLRRASDVPVLVLTARSTERDVVRGLRSGADDYLVKPIRLAELLARIDAVTRRAAARGGVPEVVEVEDLRVDLAARRVSVAGAELTLTGKEYDILAALARRSGVAVSRQQVLDEVWGDATVAVSRALDVHLASLRTKLARPGLLSTVRGFGYRLGR